MMKKNNRLQSAMEYLMTYGWAILIIAVVLGALFSLGVFSGGATLGTACVAQSGFLCQSPIVLGTNGNVSFVFGQSTGATIYNIGIACAATSTSSAGLPNPPTAMVYVDGVTGKATNVIAAGVNTAVGGGYNTLTLISGATVTVSGLSCYGTTANALRSQVIGTAFSGSLYLNYTSGSATPTNTVGGANPWLTQKVAILTLKVV